MKCSSRALGASAAATLALLSWLTWSALRAGSSPPHATTSSTSPGNGQAIPTSLEPLSATSTRTEAVPMVADPSNSLTTPGSNSDAIRFVFEGQLLLKVGPGVPPDWSRAKTSVRFEHGPHEGGLAWNSTAHVDALGALRIEVSRFRPLVANWTTLDCFRYFMKDPRSAFEFKLDHPLFETVEWCLPAQPWPTMGPEQAFTWQLGTIELTAAAGFTGLVQGPASEQGKPCRIGLLAKGPEGLPTAAAPILLVDGLIGAEYFVKAPAPGDYLVAAEAAGLRPAFESGTCSAHRIREVPPLELRSGLSIRGKVRGATALLPMEVVAQVTAEDFRLALPGGASRGFTSLHLNQQFLGLREGTLDRVRIHAKVSDHGGFEISGLAPMGHRLRALMFDSRRGNTVHLLRRPEEWNCSVVPPASGLELDCTTSRIEIVGMAGTRTLTDDELWVGALRIRPASYRASGPDLDISPLGQPERRVFQSESHSTFDVDVHWGGKLITTLPLTTGAALETSRWVIDFRALGVVE